MARLTTIKPKLQTLRPKLQAPKDEAGRSRYRDQAAPWRAWYQTERWAKLRDAILLRDLYTCQMSGVLLTRGKGDPTSATIDHIIPHRGDPALFWDESNLWAVCAQMHDTVCQSIEARHTGEAIRAAKLAHKAVGRDGYPTRPADRWVDRAHG